jgi:hypothetical protein
MTVSVVLDSAGGGARRRRWRAATPAGRHGKGMHHPAHRPTVEEIVSVMRQVTEEGHDRSPLTVRHASRSSVAGVCSAAAETLASRR